MGLGTGNIVGTSQANGLTCNASVCEAEASPLSYKNERPEDRTCCQMDNSVFVCAHTSVRCPLSFPALGLTIPG